MRGSTVRRHATRSALLRAGAVAGAAIALAGCTASTGGGGTTSATGATGTSVTPAATTASSAGASPGPTTSSAGASTGPTTRPSSGPGTPRCSTSALKGEVDLAAAGGAAGSTYYPLDLTNTSPSTCTLLGYPGVSFVTGPSGTQVGDPARRDPVTPATTVTLESGQVAHAVLQVGSAGSYDPAQCLPVTVHYLRVYPPDETTALVVPFTAQACSATLPATVGGQLGVTAIQPGAS